ncbi:alcohol dehydrogenase [Colletotrichum tofieldiae]|nr:alcohol dehydrogenase [Colletotrichum tofieldiae]GKT71147.1 alcohol dehydrogenase [Colletotrichum tofieldiae]
MPFTLTLKQKKAKGGQVYYPLQLNVVPKPSPGEKEVLIRLETAALNHRDFFLRQNLYPGLSFKSPMLSDGCGTVVELGAKCSPAAGQLVGKRVILTPFRGWDSDPTGPEDYSNFSTIGGVEPHLSLGMAQQYIAVDESEFEVCPEHLSSIEGAAIPCCGVTAWRALVTKSGNAEAGRNILVTGIGGGVALQVLLFAVAMGCNVYVSSSSNDKIERAKELGAVGGVNYKSGPDTWDKTLGAMLPAERPYIDAVIDGAGGNIVSKALAILKPGGVIVCYGMTLGPVMDWPMQAALKNVDLRGTMVGSRAEFRDMVDFIRHHKIRPVISRTNGQEV